MATEINNVARWQLAQAMRQIIRHIFQLRAGILRAFDVLPELVEPHGGSGLTLRVSDRRRQQRRSAKGTLESPLAMERTRVAAVRLDPLVGPLVPHTPTLVKGYHKPRTTIGPMLGTT
jgi:hypothetical protein